MASVALRGALAVALGISASAPAGAAEIDEVRQSIRELRSEYQGRIAELEARLAAAEADAGDVDESRGPGASAVDTLRRGYRAVTSGNQFNPQISVILNGNYFQDNVDGETSELLEEAFQAGAGHGHGEEEGHGHGAAEPGFNFREAELWFGGTVDPYFDLSSTLSVASDGDVELEEAYFQTRGLPAGFKLKAGKFFSDIGYINRQHPHEWDFTDQNLVHLNLFGFNLADTGAQLTWLPPLPVYTLLGVELLQGEQERFGALVEDEEEREELALDDEKDGPRLVTGFAKISPDLGFNHALQIGGFIAHARQSQAIGEIEEEEAGFEGDSTLFGADLVYKYDAPGAYGAGDFLLQSEYLRRRNDFSVSAFEDDPTLVGRSRDFTTDGFYIQARYGFWPRWQFGARYDAFGLTNKAEGVGGDESFERSDRWTLALTYRPTEFSMLRLHGATADIVTGEDGSSEDFEYVFLQYILTLGAHGAHKF
mgnify:CR=1 FL=1